MSRSKNQMEKIRAIMANTQSRRNLPSVFSGANMEWFDEPDFDSSAPSDWIECAEDIMQMYPASMVSRAKSNSSAPPSTRVEKIFRCGELHGTWTQGGVTHHVYMSINEEPAPAGCNCVDSAGMDPCIHSYQFIRETIRQLRTDPHLRRRIESGEFENGEPSHESFRPDPSAAAIEELNRIVERSDANLSEGENGDDCLPEIATTTPKRILWDVRESSDGYWSIHPLLQQKKKRGNGYTKGKKLRLSQLVTDRSLPTSDIDAAVIERIENEDSYYYGGTDYELDPSDACQELIGHDCVTLNGDPVRVISYPNFLTLGSAGDKHRVIFTDELASKVYQKVLGSDSALIRVDADAGEILVGDLNPEESELIRSLCNLPPVDDEHVGDLIESLSKLQRRLSVLLPISKAGPGVQQDARPAILLRSQTDGALDFGIRVRDAAGILRRPLTGPMVTATERDGKKVQLIRSPRRESDQLNQLLAKWKLSINQATWMGRIDDFEVALRLIENLQSPESDVEVLWDRTSERPVKVLGTLSNSNVKVDIAKKRDWFGITGQCDFDGHSMPLTELISSLPDTNEGGVGEYVKLGDGQWARISAGLRQRLKRLQNATHKDRNTLKLDATAAPAIRELVEADISVKSTRAWQKCIQRLANAESLSPTVPTNLNAELRDYQVDGFKWLRKLAEWGVGGILADDMGLGKTLQTLAVVLDRSTEGPTLVIAPTSVGFNWVREAERFAPDLQVHLYRETEREEFLPSVGPGSLVICSYGLALRDAKALAGVSWSTLVLDEAQAIKNGRSKTSKAIASIDADWTVALTGTPVENHLGELWSLFHVVSPGVFGGWEQFRKRYAAPIEKEGNDAARNSLAERLQPFVLRRTKSEVLTELPPRTEMNLYVDLSPAERAEYEQVRLAAIGEIDDLESQSPSQDQRFKILALMTRLRQISCHARLVNSQWTESSAKLDQLCETLESLREEGHRALVFSQFTEHLALIREALDKKGYTYEYLDGSTPAKARQVAVDQFQSGSADVFLISLKAGGTGLNLTAADYVIHMDPWWNPAVEDQATDRAHRMGQDKPVMVYRIVARGTIEEEILALHDSKRDLVAGVMQGTEAAARLTNEDLIRMLRG